MDESEIEYHRYAVRAARYVNENHLFIINTLYLHKEKMENAAKESRAAFEAAIADPALKAALDKSMMTTNGYEQSAMIFEKEAEKAQRLVDELTALLDQAP